MRHLRNSPAEAQSIPPQPPAKSAKYICSQRIRERHSQSIGITKTPNLSKIQCIYRDNSKIPSKTYFSPVKNVSNPVSILISKACAARPILISEGGKDPSGQDTVKIWLTSSPQIAQYRSFPGPECSLRPPPAPKAMNE